MRDKPADRRGDTRPQSARAPRTPPLRGERDPPHRRAGTRTRTSGASRGGSWLWTLGASSAAGKSARSRARPADAHTSAPRADERLQSPLAARHPSLAATLRARPTELIFHAARFSPFTPSGFPERVMPSFLHEALLLLLRNRATVVPELLGMTELLPLPRFSSAHIESTDLSEVVPAEYRADLLVLLRQRDRPVLGIVAEVQLAPDERKR